MMTADESGGPAQTIEQKLDTLSASVDERFTSVDQRFDGVQAALVEQRQYTEFAFDRLSGEFDRLSSEMKGGFDRLERKLDQFIDAQLTTNRLVDRRLQALEPKSGNS